MTRRCRGALPPTTPTTESCRPHHRSTAVRHPRQRGHVRAPQPGASTLTGSPQHCDPVRAFPCRPEQLRAGDEPTAVTPSP
uniref:Uncharacterized protein n=1 Tax=Arundo donax TaxID=35708 RepID=A0A0A8YHT7_ARUDO